MHDHDVEFDISGGRLTGKLVKASLTCIWVEVNKFTKGKIVDVNKNSPYFIKYNGDGSKNIKVKRARITGPIYKSGFVAPNPNGVFKYTISTMSRETPDKRETKIIKRHIKKHNVEYI